jgi:hypothetical protein
VRFRWTDSFNNDIRGLSLAHQQTFMDAVPDLSKACDRWVESRTPFPAKYRVKLIQGADGIFELTWSFAGPDGRATWEWISIEIGDKRYPAIYWRRIGSREIFKRP